MMIVKLLAYTPDADRICAAAAHSCYSEKPAAELVETVDPSKMLAHVIGMGHHSVIEHAVFTFSVEGVSRALTHQLVRHRVASYSQQSQRYVKLTDPTYVVPETVAADEAARKLFEEEMDRIWDSYSKLIDMGIPAEDARYVLPNGCTTNITVTMNARELLHFFSMRCCNRAQWEIREMADEMLRLCKEVSPIIFRNAGPACVRGVCPEGKKTCGRPRTDLKDDRGQFLLSRSSKT